MSALMLKNSEKLNLFLTTNPKNNPNEEIKYPVLAAMAAPTKLYLSINKNANEMAQTNPAKLQPAINFNLPSPLK